MTGAERLGSKDGGRGGGWAIFIALDPAAWQVA